MPEARAPAERIAAIRQLWEQGLSTAAIATALGLTKNAVVGIAHRHGCTPRPSPIVRTTGAPTRRGLSRDAKRLAAGQVAAPAAAPPEPAPAPAPAPIARWPSDRGCRWPLWADDAAPDGRFCGAAFAPWPNSSGTRAPTYCAAHMKRAMAPRGGERG